MEQKSEFPWDILDTSSLLLNEELLTYHLYKLSQTKKKNGDKDILPLIKKYNDKLKEVNSCLQIK